MKLNNRLSYFLGLLAFAVALLSLPLQVNAETMAYWRFEEGPEGAQVPHGGFPNGVFFPGVPDTSGNGNDLSVWTEGWAGYAYRADIPASVIPQSGAANNLAVQNTGTYPTFFTGSPGMAGWTPAAFTIEASFKPEIGWWRTIVGRDSFGAVGIDPRLSALYFQITPGDAVAIKFADVSGVWHEAVSDFGLITGFPWPYSEAGRWYHMAAVSDGSTLSLYLDDVNANTGYRLVARTDMRGTSPNTMLTSGYWSGVDWTAGTWSVGRGLYGGIHTDRAYGLIDEVRISDAALRPDQFLFSTPWTNPPIVVRINDTPADNPVIQVIDAPNGWSLGPDPTASESTVGAVITLHGVDQYSGILEQGWRFVVPNAPDSNRNAVDIIWLQHDYRRTGGGDSLQVVFNSAKAGHYYASPELVGDSNAGIVTDQWVRLYADDFIILEYKPHTNRLRE